MNQSNYSGPISHRELRALLRVIERASEQKDREALEDAHVLASVMPDEYKTDVREYVNGLSERARDGNYKAYYMYTDGDVEAMRDSLELIAYGNFDEAMQELEYDLRSLDRYSSDQHMSSRVFKPELFTSEDRIIWKELQDIADIYLHERGEDDETAIENAVKKLRLYQQKSYGPLIPTMTATYRNKNEGVSVRLAWYDNCLHVQTHAPFIEEIDEYFITTAPIKDEADFTPACFPDRFDEYALGDTEVTRLFKHEW
jgi:hypothetical protein